MRHDVLLLLRHRRKSLLKSFGCVRPQLPVTDCYNLRCSGVTGPLLIPEYASQCQQQGPPPHCGTLSVCLRISVYLFKKRILQFTEARVYRQNTNTFVNLSGVQTGLNHNCVRVIVDTHSFGIPGRNVQITTCLAKSAGRWITALMELTSSPNI